MLPRKHAKDRAKEVLGADWQEKIKNFSSTLKESVQNDRAVQDGDLEHGSLMAGQSVGLVDRVMPVREIMTRLLEGTESELKRVRESLEDAG